MPNLDDFGLPQEESQNTHANKAKGSTRQSQGEPIFDTTSAEQSSNDKGLSMEEINDPNRIQVTVADDETPLVILFGPPASGKTMTLVRLARFLRKNNYTVKPVTSFRPSRDKKYQELCEGFDEMLSNEDAALSTSNISFMLTLVSKGGRPLCQILEGPGELYFDPKNPKADFPKFVHAITSSNNRKIWLILVEPDNTNRKMDVQERLLYVEKIKKLQRTISPRDRVIFVYNKIDETEFVVHPGVTKDGDALKSMKDNYKGLLEAFRNENPITKLWRPFDFDFVTFQTGYFSSTREGDLTFQEGHDNYPRKLWNILSKRLRG